MANHENPLPWIGGSQNPFQHRWDAEAIVIGKVGRGKTTNLVPPLQALPDDAPGDAKNDDHGSHE